MTKSTELQLGNEGEAEAAEGTTQQRGTEEPQVFLQLLTSAPHL